MRRLKGFTLIELMIVLGITMVLASIPVIAAPGWQLNGRISRAQNVLAGILRDARGRAIANRTFVRVRIAGNVLDVTEGRCAIGSAIDNCDSNPGGVGCAPCVGGDGCPAGANCTFWVRRAAMTIGPVGDYFRVTINVAPGGLPSIVTFNPWGQYVEGTARTYSFGPSGDNFQGRQVVLSSSGTVRTR